MKITLFQFESKSISINIQAYFQDEDLIIEGYDIGKSVAEWMGDSDYEYTIKVPATEVQKLYPLMNVLPCHKEGLLKAIADRFHTNTCYSEFNEFLQKNGIKSEGFSWA